MESCRSLAYQDLLILVVVILVQRLLKGIGASVVRSLEPAIDNMAYRLEQVTNIYL